jgi:hypothetical protein
MIYPTPKTFSLLILDMNKISPRISLKAFLQQISAQYCIVLNASYSDIQSIKNTYRVATHFIHSPRSCVVLSYKGIPEHFTHPAQVSWDNINNNPCLHIQIQGVNLLLTYLPPHSPKKRRKLLENLETGHFKDYKGKELDIHLLITYLDTKIAIEPDLLTTRYRWQYVEADNNQSSFTLSSFHILANVEIKNIQYPETLDILEDRNLRIPPSAGYITYIPCLSGWEIDHLNICSQLDHSSNIVS